MYSLMTSLTPGSPSAVLDHRPERAGEGRKTGIILSNLGTPDGTDYRSVRRYLAEFLSDPRVVELPRALWLPILHGMVLSLRPGPKGRVYRTIWNKELNESPLKTVTRRQAFRLQGLLDAKAIAGNAKVIVDWGMRYGNPSIASAVERLSEQGCEQILMVPLYPQYSATTTASACDALFKVITRMRHQPSVRIARPYYDHPLYIAALARSVKSRLSELDFVPDVVVASFHGIPQRNVSKGDPYYFHCLRTGELLRESLALDGERFLITFQSRFGPARWLTPYTESTVKQLAKEGVKRIAVIAPGFSADCIETIDEIARENAGYFYRAGGERFAYIKCLNDSDDGMRLIEGLVTAELKGWA